jgi:hypothetical protein
LKFEIFSKNHFHFITKSLAFAYVTYRQLLL